MTTRLPLRAAALGTATAVIGLLAAPALAAGNDGSGNVAVVNTETVQVYTSATGEIQGDPRVYEQLNLTGHGTVDLSNPVSTDHLRNLDGFGGLTVQDGHQVTKTTVDGSQQLRSVSNYDGKLPLDVSVAYKLDGRQVQPGDVVGKSGRLEVTYTVKNVTSVPQQLTFDSGTGSTVTKTVDVPIPLVGTLDLVAPPSFTHVTSNAANMGGDGKGGTKLSFTMTLFPPIGTDTAVFGYSADITDGVVPRAEITALPVNPLQSPTFKSAGASYKGGADSGVQLTEGATLIDTNLLKLRDGAAKLLDGIIQLHDGSKLLEAGLAGQAAPGSQKLATGAGQLDTGLGQLDAGGQQLKAGTGQAYAGSKKLAAGTGQLTGGADQLAAGQHALEKGLHTLYVGVKGLPKQVSDELAVNPDYQQALLGLQLAIAGIGDNGDLFDPKPGQSATWRMTLLGGINAVQQGLFAKGGTNPAECGKVLAGQPGDCGAFDAVKLIGTSLSQSADPAAKQAGATLLGIVAQAHTKLLDGYDIPGETAGSQHHVLPAFPTIQLGLSNPNADSTKCAENLLNPPKACGIKQVQQALLAGLPVLVDTLTNKISQQLLAGIGTPTPGCNPKKTLRCGAAALTDGTDQLVAGAKKLDAGAGQLSTGLGQIDTGAGKLSNGLGQAKDGSGQVADGAQQLAVGIGKAADGSSQLSAGLGKAAKGTPKLVDGAQQLSTKGTKKLVAAGQDTAQTYGEQYAVFKAGAHRATTQAMAYGAPKGALGLTAYNFVIQGESGETGHDWVRGVGGLALLGAGGAAFALRRRAV